MRLIFTFTLFIVSYLSLYAQYTTPNTGVKWTLLELSQQSDSVVLVTDSGYHILQPIIVSVSDTLMVDSGPMVVFNTDVLITVFGGFVATPTERIAFVPAEGADSFLGLRFEEGSYARLSHIDFFKAGGIRSLNRDFVIDNCTLKEFNIRLNTGGALEVSRGNPQVLNCTFEDNARAAISSAANARVSPFIFGCQFLRNSTQNTNRPQINLGPSAEGDTTKIINNMVIGEYTMAGGIAFSSLLSIEADVLIQGNYVQNNRYGIAITGNGIRSTIANNILLDNNIQNLPLLGGSGININTSASGFNHAIITGNTIAGNLWGITLQGNSTANLGDNEGVSGDNTFRDNGNEGSLYALFNNTPNEIPAMHNCWREGEEVNEALIEEVIAHQVDDPALGEVIFVPFKECITTSTSGNLALESIKVYPNPTHNWITIERAPEGSIIQLWHISGSLAATYPAPVQGDTIHWPLSNMAPGMYILQVRHGGATSSQKLQINQ
jgi:parallel beta-helix repeat protein